MPTGHWSHKFGILPWHWSLSTNRSEVVECFENVSSHEIRPGEALGPSTLSSSSTNSSQDPGVFGETLGQEIDWQCAKMTHKWGLSQTYDLHDSTPFAPSRLHRNADCPLHLIKYTAKNVLQRWACNRKCKKSLVTLISICFPHQAESCSIYIGFSPAEGHTSPNFDFASIRISNKCLGFGLFLYNHHA